MKYLSTRFYVAVVAGLLSMVPRSLRLSLRLTRSHVEHGVSGHLRPLGGAGFRLVLALSSAQFLMSSTERTADSASVCYLYSTGCAQKAVSWARCCLARFSAELSQSGLA